MNHAFEQGKLRVNAVTCPTLAAALEQQAYAKSGEPDKEGGFDHPCDALGYLAVKELPVRKPKRDDRAPQKPQQDGYAALQDDDEADGWKVV